MALSSSPGITFKWSGGALQPGETFLVEIIPYQPIREAAQRTMAGAGINTSGPLTDHEWTTDITRVAPGKASPARVASSGASTCVTRMGTRSSPRRAIIWNGIRFRNSDCGFRSPLKAVRTWQIHES